MDTSTATQESHLSPRRSDSLPPFLRRHMESIPLLTLEQMQAKFVALRQLHNEAWEAVLCVRPCIDVRGEDSDWDNLRSLQRSVAPRSAAVRTTARALERAANDIVDANLRLCVHIASRDFRRSPLPFDDRVQAAAIGCHRAVKTFDHTRGLRFSTYAAHWIRQSIQRITHDTAAEIRIPVHMQLTKETCNRARVRIELDTGRTATAEEIAARSNRTTDSVMKAAHLPTTISGFLRVRKGPTESTIMDTIVDDARATDVENLLDQQIKARHVEAMLATLPPRTADIIRGRYGFHEGEDETHKETAARIGVCRERVRQIENQALRELRTRVPVL